MPTRVLIAALFAFLTTAFCAWGVTQSAIFAVVFLPGAWVADVGGEMLAWLGIIQPIRGRRALGLGLMSSLLATYAIFWGLWSAILIADWKQSRP